MASCAESRVIIFKQWLQVASGLLVFALRVHLTIYANIGLSIWVMSLNEEERKICL